MIWCELIKSLISETEKDFIKQIFAWLRCWNVLNNCFTFQCFYFSKDHIHIVLLFYLYPLPFYMFICEYHFNLMLLNLYFSHQDLFQRQNITVSALQHLPLRKLISMMTKSTYMPRKKMSRFSFIVKSVWNCWISV